MKKTWDKIDLKVFILCLLDQLQHPMNYTDIVDTVMDSGSEAGFDFTECFLELMEEGHILSDVIDNETYYIISTSGSMVAKELRSTIPQKLLYKANISAAKHLELSKMGIVATASISSIENGYNVHIVISKDQQSNLLDMNLYCSTQEQAQNVKIHIESAKAESIYQCILTAATGNVDYIA